MHARKNARTTREAVRGKNRNREGPGGLFFRGGEMLQPDTVPEEVFGTTEGRDEVPATLKVGSETQTGPENSMRCINEFFTYSKLAHPRKISKPGIHFFKTENN